MSKVISSVFRTLSKVKIIGSDTFQSIHASRVIWYSSDTIDTPPPYSTFLCLIVHYLLVGSSLYPIRMSTLGNREMMFHLGSYYNTSYPLPRPLLHKLIDPHIQQAMDTIVNTGVDPNLYFPLSSLHHDFFSEGQTRQEALSAIHQHLVHDGVYSKDQRRWIIPKDQDSDEVSHARFFNTVVKQAYRNGKTCRIPYVWRSHAEVLVESMRKPDVILVPVGHQNVPQVHFRTIQSYCELKYRDKQDLVDASLQQVVELSNHISTTQLSRRFFVGMSLCGSALTLLLIARGATVISKPLNIDHSPIDFLRILLGITSCSPEWTGIDENFLDDGDGLTLQFDKHDVHVTNRVVFISLSSQTRSSKVWFCHAYRRIHSDLSKPIPCILKDCWMESGLTTDIDIHRFLRDCKPLPFGDDEERQLFGSEDKYHIFDGCLQFPAEWSDTPELRGIPIVLEQQEVTCAIPGFGSISDTTENILRRFGSLPRKDNRKHIRLLYETVGAPIVWFSCRREFFNVMMGAVVALNNGARKQVLHCDSGDTNVMMVVEDLDAERVVPDWPKGTAQYPKRAGMLTDWGYAIDLCCKTGANKSGQMTGTFPFTAAEPLQSERVTNHDLHHDLESLFWVMFITSVNFSGPFNKRREWQDATSNSPFPFVGNVKLPVEPVPTVLHPCAPAWATPGLHTCHPDDIYEWKRSIPIPSFLAAMDPYWTSNKGGKAFVDGMVKLAGYFRQHATHDGKSLAFSYPKQVTPKIFLKILHEIREAIPDVEDHPSDDEILEARRRYQETLDTNRGLEAPLLHPTGALASDAAFPVSGGSKRQKPPTKESPPLKRTRREPPRAGTSRTVHSEAPRTSTIPQLRQSGGKTKGKFMKK